MEKLSIERIGMANVDEVAVLFDLYRQFYEQQPDLGISIKFLESRLANNESIILAARSENGEMLGFCQIYPTFCSVIAEPIYVLYDLFVLPNHRKKGIAKSLLISAADLAKISGITRMDLTTAKTNLAAQSVYESLGWVRDEVFYTYNLSLPLKSDSTVNLAS